MPPNDGSHHTGAEEFDQEVARRPVTDDRVGEGVRRHSSTVDTIQPGWYRE